MSKTIIKAPKMPSGTDDFADMRNIDIDTIADKTRFLPDLLSEHEPVVLFTRPIRFMKSSTFSMIAKFLSIKDAESNKNLFNGLDISDKKYDSFREEYQGKFPVVHLTFKGIRFETWDKTRDAIGDVMASLYKEHKHILPFLDEGEQAKYLRIMNNECIHADLEMSLYNMSRYLYKYHKKEVIILIDEYDTPLQSAYTNNKKEDLEQPGSYFQSMLNFMVTFLKAALKGNPYLNKGFINGVLYIPFSSLFSSLNNINSYSIFRPEFAEIFGFTEDDVDSFINKVEGIDEKQRKKLSKVIQDWYNGYYIGNESVRIYNPCSVGKFFNSLPKNPNMLGRPYCLQVENSLGIFKHLEPRYEALQSTFAQLMLNKKVRVRTSERMELSDLNDPNNLKAFWGLLLHTGYLSPSNIRYSNEEIICDIAIPNHEIQSAYAYLINKYQSKYDPEQRYNNAITESLEKGDISAFSQNLTKLMEQAVSFYDLKKDNLHENVYHAFILGLLSGMLTNYKISSNRESGYGRYDITLTPREKGGHGFIFELKSTTKRISLKKDAEESLSQIESMRYSAELEANDVTEGIHIGMSFYGKHFHIAHKKVSYLAEACETL